MSLTESSQAASRLGQRFGRSARDHLPVSRRRRQLASWTGPPIKIAEASGSGRPALGGLRGGRKTPGSREVENWLRDVFHFHPLAVEDALQETHVPKVDDWGAYLYIVFRVPRIDSGSGSPRAPRARCVPRPELPGHLPRRAAGDPRAENGRASSAIPATGCDTAPIISCSASSSWRSTSRSPPSSSSTSTSTRSRTTSSSIPVPKVIRTIFRIKRSAIQLHKMLSPQREVLNRWPAIPIEPIQAEHRVYFRDLYDHVVRIHDISESLRDLISGTLETYLSVISNRTNDIMKTLTIVSVMFLPMSFLAGFFGMNFFGEPLAFRGPTAAGLALRADLRDHGVIPVFHLDLRASARNGSDGRPIRGPAGEWTSPTMNARWRLRPHDPTRMLELSRGSGLSPLVAQLLLNRGIDDPSRPDRFPRGPDGEPARPRAAARRGRGGRADRPGDPMRTGRSSSTAITTSTACAAPASSGPA